MLSRTYNTHRMRNNTCPFLHARYNEIFLRTERTVMRLSGSVSWLHNNRIELLCSIELQLHCQYTITSVTVQFCWEREGEKGGGDICRCFGNIADSSIQTLGAYTRDEHEFEIKK